MRSVANLMVILLWKPCLQPLVISLSLACELCLVVGLFHSFWWNLFSGKAFQVWGIIFCFFDNFFPLFSETLDR